MSSQASGTLIRSPPPRPMPRPPAAPPPPPPIMAGLRRRLLRPLRPKGQPLPWLRPAAPHDRARPLPGLRDRPAGWRGCRGRRGSIEQLVVGAARHQPAALQHQDDVGGAHGRDAMGDHERRAAVHQSPQRGANQPLGGDVDGRGELVQDQHSRVEQQRARDRHALLLAARKRHAALADDGVVALGQAGDELVGASGAGRLADRRPRRHPVGRSRCSRGWCPRTASSPA